MTFWVHQTSVTHTSRSLHNESSSLPPTSSSHSSLFPLLHASSSGAQRTSSSPELLPPPHKSERKRARARVRARERERETERERKGNTWFLFRYLTAPTSVNRYPIVESQFWISKTLASTAQHYNTEPTLALHPAPRKENRPSP